MLLLWFIKLKKWLLITVGWLATGLGFLGVFLPILPTVPFILLAMLCFSKSSPRFQIWLQNNQYLGSTVTRIKLNQGLTVREKQKILIYSWLSIVTTIVFLLERIELQVLLSIILVIETWFILRYKTCQSTDNASTSSSL
ncbi:YbaN family protein [Vibrio algarum]|uniref:Inner membrane protein n=1 Tax=Vibrio algarum TaxID=3020714 RepID=A0ABT4YX44_9VIBR|nr:YbaN family protein [Vibrio sp. KJ40-1]MDB1126158.1 YbaN family protein [Vibrio sp. KJ40-1]